MTDPDLLAALIAERQDHRWFPTPEKTAADLNVGRDDEMTCRRRLRALVDDDMDRGRWVMRRGVKVWVAA